MYEQNIRMVLGSQLKIQHTEYILHFGLAYSFGGDPELNLTR